MEKIRRCSNIDPAKPDFDPGDQIQIFQKHLPRLVNPVTVLVGKITIRLVPPNRLAFSSG
jgi:hypothetical protein